MSANAALSDDEWGAWGKPEAAAKPEEVQSNPNDSGKGFANDDSSNNNGVSKFKSNNQDNFGKSYQEKRGGYNGNRGGNDNRFSSKREDDTDNRYKQDGRNTYNNRNQDDFKRNGNNYEKDNNKLDDSRENRGGYRNQKRDSSKENRNYYQHDDRSNGNKRDDSRENRGSCRNTRKEGFKRDDSEESRSTYRNPRKNDYKRDDSLDDRSKYRNKNDTLKRDDSSENRSNYRKPKNHGYRRDDSDDSRKNYRNSKKDGFNRDDSRERNSYRNNDRRNDSRERRRNDSRERRNDSTERKRSDYKGRSYDGPSQSRSRDVEKSSDKFDKNSPSTDQLDQVNTTLKYIKSIPDEKTLVFFESRRMVDFFAKKLDYLGFKATTMHDDSDQEQRRMALNDFKSGRVNFMVATNAAARNLDIPDTDNVIHIDMPGDIDRYVHRIRRADKRGGVSARINTLNRVIIL